MTPRLRVPATLAAIALAPALALGVVTPAVAATTSHTAAAHHLSHEQVRAQALKAAKAAKAARAKAAAAKAAKAKAAAAKAKAAKAAAAKLASVGQATTSVGSISGALFQNSDYPYANAPATGGDTLNMGVRQCTSYAAWALTREGVVLTPDPTGGADVVGPAGTGHLADARTWAAAAQAAGYTVDSTPAVGAIAQWNANEKSTWANPDGSHGWLTAGAEGHVGVVVAVNDDGTAVIRDYNGWVSLGFSEHSEIAPRYLHIGVS
jgi:surface antigen